MKFITRNEVIDHNVGSVMASWSVLAVVVLVIGCSAFLRAQSLGWEGETGIFVTPLAYTATSETHFAEPVVAYHFLDAGPVIGDFHEASITVGFAKRFEAGYTHEMHVTGDDATLSPLWQNGLEIFHGKARLVPENYKKHPWVPAVSLGFMARTGVRNVGDLVTMPGGGMSATDNGKTNGDVYLVGSKVVSQSKPIPLILSAGVRGTNAELWGMGGNAPDWQARGFGALAFVFKGPSKSSIVVGSEVAQQPHHPLGFPTLNIPTTLTYCARFAPSSSHKLNFDFGIAQIAGNAMPGVNLKARHQAGVQVSYGF